MNGEPGEEEAAFPEGGMVFQRGLQGFIGRWPQTHRGVLTLDLAQTTSKSLPEERLL